MQKLTIVTLAAVVLVQISVVVNMKDRSKQVAEIRKQIEEVERLNADTARRQAMLRRLCAVPEALDRARNISCEETARRLCRAVPTPQGSRDLTCEDALRTLCSAPAPYVEGDHHRTYPEGTRNLTCSDVLGTPARPGYFSFLPAGWSAVAASIQINFVEQGPRAASESMDTDYRVWDETGQLRCDEAGHDVPLRIVKWPTQRIQAPEEMFEFLEYSTPLHLLRSVSSTGQFSPR